MKRAIAAIAVAASLAACTTTNQAQGVDIGWSTLNAAAQTADQLALSGKLHGAQAAKVKADLDQATLIMQAADAAHAQNPNADTSVQIAQAAALVSEVISITAGVPK